MSKFITCCALSLMDKIFQIIAQILSDVNFWKIFIPAISLALLLGVGMKQVKGYMKNSPEKKKGIKIFFRL